MTVRVLATPWNTRDSVSYLVGDAVFIGDTLFKPDSGSARCDFPGGDSRQLYRSVVERLFALPPSTRVFVCHDYRPGGREASRHGRHRFPTVDVKPGGMWPTRPPGPIVGAAG